jgi:hypothetical protein
MSAIIVLVHERSDLDRALPKRSCGSNGQLDGLGYLVTTLCPAPGADKLEVKPCVSHDFAQFLKLVRQLVELDLQFLLCCSTAVAQPAVAFRVGLGDHPDNIGAE